MYRDIGFAISVALMGGFLLVLVALSENFSSGMTIGMVGYSGLVLSVVVFFYTRNKKP